MFEAMDFRFLNGDDNVLEAAVEQLGAANFAFDSWFTPFRSRYATAYVHD